MKILLAADGSNHTEKALSFIVNHKHLMDAQSDILVVNVQPLLPTVFNAVISVADALAIHNSEAEKVFSPIRNFLDQNHVTHRCISMIGPIASKIITTAVQEQASLIVMGTHGREYVANAVLGSVAQKVVASSTVPALLVH